MSNSISNDGGTAYSEQYLKEIKNMALTRMDKAGNGDGKVTVNEALKDLDIGGLLNGQNADDTKKIKTAAKNIEQVLAKYAGTDGVFSAQEWADFLNGDEWGSVLDVWHSSGRKAQLEMDWTDRAHIKDNKMTKGEVKVGILNNLLYNKNKYGMNIPTDTTEIEAIIDKYAGPDGTFTLAEYKQMKNDPVYKEFVEQYNVTPWYKQFGLQ